MSRSRNIKPGFFKNEVLVELPFECRLLFIGLWTMADRAGRLEDRPTKIKMELFPADSVNTDASLQSLHDSGFILRYVVDGKRLIQIIAWDKHQNPHVKEAKSILPASVEHGAGTRQGATKEDASPSDSLNLIPDSPIPLPSDERGGGGFEIQAEQLCRQLEALGCLHCKPTSVDLLAAFAEGVTQRALLDHWKAANKAGKRSPFAYAITAARNDRKAGAASVSSPDPPRPTMGPSGPMESPLEKEINLAWHEFRNNWITAEQRDSRIEAAKSKHDAARNSEAVVMTDSRLPFGNKAHQQGVT